MGHLEFALEQQQRSQIPFCPEVFMQNLRLGVCLFIWECSSEGRAERERESYKGRGEKKRSRAHLKPDSSFYLNGARVHLKQDSSLPNMGLVVYFSVFVLFSPKQDSSSRNVGLELRNHEIMTWVTIKCLSPTFSTVFLLVLPRNSSKFSYQKLQILLRLLTCWPVIFLPPWGCDVVCQDPSTPAFPGRALL